MMLGRSLVVVVLLLVTLPLVVASDDPAHGHAAYTTGASVNVLTIQSPPTSLCQDDCPLGLSPMGNAIIEPEGGGLWHDVLVQFDDDLWGEEAAYRVCPVIADPIQPACGFDAFVGCGTSVLFVPVVHLKAVQVDIYGFSIQEDLRLCGATTGAVLAAFFHPHPA